MSTVLVLSHERPLQKQRYDGDELDNIQFIHCPRILDAYRDDCLKLKESDLYKSGFYVAYIALLSLHRIPFSYLSFYLLFRPFPLASTFVLIKTWPMQVRW